MARLDLTDRAAALETARPALEAMGSMVVHAGPVGAGTRFKLARNLMHFVAFTAATEAQRLGIDYRKGQQGQSSTANGVVPNWRVRLASVRIGDVEVYDVDASVLPTSMPYVLLGNSFLGRFDLKRTNDQLVLDRRY